MSASSTTPWVVLSRELVADLVDLYDAEIAQTRADLRGFLGSVLKAAILFTAAGFVVFWVMALVAFVLVQVVALWLPLWGAALVVTGFYLLVAGVLAFIGWRYVEQLDDPIEVVFKRLRDHLQWWRSEVAFRPPGVETYGEESWSREEPS